jgi:purine-binding chemotaxis protein CheW
MEDTSDVNALMEQYLSFSLDGELFAIDVACIHEIIDRTDLTRIPRMPDFMRGVINLRGSVVPVVDLRMKFDMGQVEDTVDSCIVVLEVDVDGEMTAVGAFVDAVQEVFDFGAEQMEPPPKMGTRLNTDFIKGMGRRGDGFIIVLDASRVFSVDEIQAVQSAAQADSNDESEVSSQ